MKPKIEFELNCDNSAEGPVLKSLNGRAFSCAIRNSKMFLQYHLGFCDHFAFLLRRFSVPFAVPR